MTEKIKNTCLVTVEWHNAGAVIYRFESDREITIDRICDWLVAVEGFDENRDSATIHDEEGPVIDLDEALPKRFCMEYDCDKCGHHWTMEHSCACDDRCPQCDTSTSPTDYEDIAEVENATE